MKKFLIPSLLLLALVISSAMPHLVNQIAGHKKPSKIDSYKDSWVKVDSLVKLGLSQSAVKMVDAILDKAHHDNEAAQIVKCYIYKSGIYNAYEEEPLVKTIHDLEAEIQASAFPTKNVLQSIQAEMYWNYYQTNRWKINGRTVTVDFKSDDLETWDASKFADKAIKLYLQSLQSEDLLKNMSVAVFDSVLVQHKETRNLRPTLYDFLAQRAVEFFANDEADVTHAAHQFSIENAKYFSPAAGFAKMKLDADKDSLSFKFYALQTFQNLLEFHLKDATYDALIDADLKRLEFVYSNSVIDNKDSLYLDALTALQKKYSSSPASSVISFKIASFFSAQANKYNRLSKTQDHKWDNKTAVDFCEKAITNFPGSFGAANCDSLKRNILVPELSLNMEEVNVPDKPFRALVNYKNISRIYVRIIRTSDAIDSKLMATDYDKKLTYLNTLQPDSAWFVNLPDDGDYQTHAAEIKMPKLKPGKYITVVSDRNSDSGKENVGTFDYTRVSDLSYVFRNNEDGKVEVYVLNRETGEPLKGVKVTLFSQYYNYVTSSYSYHQIATYNTDKDGYFAIPAPSDYRNFKLKLEYKNDVLDLDDQMYQNSSYNYEQEKYTRIFYFIDRAIYRPGQTIYFKGLAIETDGKTNTIKKNFKTKVTFYDVNYQEVASVDVTTNDFGTFNGTFTAPDDGLNGTMHIGNDYGTKYFSVEEYKRPKFEVEFNPIEDSYHLNDTVTISGDAKAYAGSNIDGAQVKYHVMRSVSFPHWDWWEWRMPYPSYPQTQMATGVTQTDADGKFTIKFIAQPERSISKQTQPVFYYTLYADVTDISGETISNTTSVGAGYTALNLSTNLTGDVHREELDSLKILATNLNSNPQKVQGEIKIYKLKNPDRILRSRLWDQADRYTMAEVAYHASFPSDIYADEDNPTTWERETMVFQMDFNTETTTHYKLDAQKWDDGKYVALTTTKDKYGEPVESVQYFNLWSENHEMPLNSPSVFYDLKMKAEPGENASFIAGTSLKDVHALYEVVHQNKVEEKKWLTLSNEKTALNIPVAESDRGNLFVKVAFVKDSRFYSYERYVQVPYTNKELKVKFETFRDKLEPGTDEQWKIKISGPKGEKVAAEMIATMYDASLDAFTSNNFDFDIYPTYWNDDFGTWSEQGFSLQSSSTFYLTHSNYGYKYYQYDELNWFGFVNYETYNYRRNYKKGDVGTYYDMDETASFGFAEKGEEDKNNMETKAADSLSGDDRDGVTTPVGGNTGGGGGKGPQTVNLPPVEQVQVRKNLQETAFFYPQLMTDDSGSIVISFKAPEALTRWKFMAFAHTQDLQYGLLSDETVTQKDLMVMPNPPRFMREGDKMSFSAKVSNLSDGDVTGNARLELHDVVSNKDVSALFGITNQDISFTAKKGQSAPLSWDISVPDGIDAVTYKIVAQTDKHSDGEENAIPVLRNTMLVTETLPLWVNGNSSKTFELTKLVHSADSKTLKNHKLTLEFSSNPAWYAIQALPYLIEYPYECSEQTFDRYYANGIASFIANSHPNIKAVFDSWKNSGSLISNLDKNEELKTVLLQETPWVMDAQNETERKKRIALLFDLNKMANEKKTALKKLENNQAPNGGWPWFAGGPEDPYITQYIVEGFGHMDHLGIDEVNSDRKVRLMIENAVSYLDTRTAHDYAELKKNKKLLEADNLSEEVIHYLYSRSYFPEIQMSADCKEAVDYYTQQTKKFWNTKSRYMQGMLALTLNRQGDINTATKIINALKENALHSEEMGMYWAENTGGYYWYQAPIETQALLIEAFNEVTKDKESVEAMKTWLLKQKQVQDWKTTKATAEACYALLMTGNDWIMNAGDVQITLGRLLVDPKALPDVTAEAGTGYFKTSWSGHDFNPDMGKVTVTKHDDGSAWGALYWQYFEQLDKITPSVTPLSLVKKLFVEESSANGPVIKPLDDNAKLAVGDKVIVRIELRVDRDMEYVHMKDMRAAGFEPMNVFSEYKWQGGLGYYESTGDVATNFFFDRLPKGTYVFEYPVRVSNKGDFSNGIATIECMYAPEFTSHSDGLRVLVQ